MSARVTAVVPTTGRPELLRAVTSALAQTVPTEVVVVVARPQASSTVSRLLAELPADLAVDAAGGLRVLETDEPLNGAQARNRGLAVATAGWTAFLDDDDWWEPDKSRLQLAALEGVPGPAVSTTAAVLWRDGRRGAPVPVRPYDDSAGTAADYVLRRPRLRYGHHLLQTSTLLAATETLRAVPWDPALDKHQDWDLFVRLFDEHGCRHAFVERPLTHIAQDSAASVSKRSSVPASLRWVSGVPAAAGARNDFVLAVPLRNAAAERDWAGVRSCLRALRPGAPSLGALAVAAASVTGALRPGRRG